MMNSGGSRTNSGVSMTNSGGARTTNVVLGRTVEVQCIAVVETGKFLDNYSRLLHTTVALTKRIAHRGILGATVALTKRIANSVTVKTIVAYI